MNTNESLIKRLNPFGYHFDRPALVWQEGEAINTLCIDDGDATWSWDDHIDSWMFFNSMDDLLASFGCDGTAPMTDAEFAELLERCDIR